MSKYFEMRRITHSQGSTLFTIPLNNYNTCKYLNTMTLNIGSHYILFIFPIYLFIYFYLILLHNTIFLCYFIFWLKKHTKKLKL